jgi:acetoin utilization deacetylase AcuC-like enzyme
VTAIVDGLEQSGLLDRLIPIPERIATDTELQLIHHPGLVEILRKLDAAGGAVLDPDTTLLTGSFDAAARAVGGALNAVDRVLGVGAHGRAPLQAAFCLDRPPGHHATPTRSMGFCFFNQVAITARYAQRVHGVDRVAIVDIDVHHGNGTQDAFEEDSSVLYCSTHEYPFYPGTGHWRETGAGNVVNLALPAGCGDVEYAAAFEQVIVPAVRRFEPELLLVSSGFDAHLADPLADMAVTESGYAHMAGRIQQLADELSGGRAVWVLEGGYRLEALSRSVVAVLRVLLGETESVAVEGTPRDDVIRLLRRIVELHRLDGRV